MSRAQVVSDASTGLPFRSPSTSGRMPSGSRTPISFLLVRATQGVAALDLADGVDEPVDDPRFPRPGYQVEDHLAVGGRLEDGPVRHQLVAQARKLVRLPLWARATPPASRSANIGWTLRMSLPPAVLDDVLLKGLLMNWPDTDFYSGHARG